MHKSAEAKLAWNVQDIEREQDMLRRPYWALLAYLIECEHNDDHAGDLYKQYMVPDNDEQGRRLHWRACRA